MSWNTKIRMVWLLVFALSMAFFESSVVVYLRKIYYPDGFAFPLIQMDSRIALTEFFREVASLIMIVSVAGIVFSNFYKRFAAFLFIFAVWDIFYYVFLKLLLNWPDSLFTWDILFLIPVTWTGPVIAPILISLIMILLSFIVLYFKDKNNERFAIAAKEWMLMVVGAFVVFLSFVWDYSRFLLINTDFEDAAHIIKSLKVLTLNYTPVTFNWLLFFIGVAFILLSVFIIFRKNKVDQSCQ